MYPAIKSWIFPYSYVNVYQAGYLNHRIIGSFFGMLVKFHHPSRWSVGLRMFSWENHEPETVMEITGEVDGEKSPRKSLLHCPMPWNPLKHHGEIMAGWSVGMMGKSFFPAMFQSPLTRWEKNMVFLVSEIHRKKVRPQVMWHLPRLNLAGFAARGPEIKKGIPNGPRIAKMRRQHLLVTWILVGMWFMTMELG